MSMKFASRPCSGFTLAELIVSMALLAILAVVGLISLSGYSQDAKDAAVKTNVNLVMTAISSEAALTGNSPRRYVMHDESASLTGGASAYSPGSLTFLTGGQYGTEGTNYSAGSPDWIKLKLSSEKFYSAVSGKFATTAFSIFRIPAVSADNESKSIFVGAFDSIAVGSSPIGTRSASSFQVVGINPATGLVTTAGDYPIGLGGVAGLVRKSDSAGAHDVLIENATYYPDCDTADIPLANGQIWSSCNVGATSAWTGALAYTDTGATNRPDDYNASLRFTLGGLYQWGRNKNVRGSATVAGPISANADTDDRFVYVSNSSPYDWLAQPDDNLWGGSGTLTNAGVFADLSPSNRLLMAGPCAQGYHVPTSAEWWSAMNTLNSSLTNTGVAQADTSVRNTLRLPRSGQRSFTTGNYTAQGNVGVYWTSSRDGVYALCVLVRAPTIQPSSRNFRALGHSIRCIKD